MINKVTNIMHVKIEYGYMSFVQRTYGITSSYPQ